jgi:hypothetical protein
MYKCQYRDGGNEELELGREAYKGLSANPKVYRSR